MSKAFTKEDAESNADDELPEDLQVPRGTKNYMTPRGAQRLRDELHRLLHLDRPEVVKTVSWAASNGDRSENGDYIYGKRRLREIDRRIRFLTKRLDAAEVVDPGKQSGDRVLFGAQVTVLDEEGRKKRYQIVGIDEADVPHGKISWISPMARALLNQAKGDVVTLRTPKGDEELEILEVRYESES
jgi:transcription elongation factor GreB